jgi:hypothetical protein
MGKNRIWYAFLWLGVAALLVSLLPFHYQLCRTELRRSSWTTIFSPSTYVFVAAMFETLFFPAQILLMIPGLFVDAQSNAELFNKRYRLSLLAVLAICAGEFLLLTLMWGSLPLEVDAQNYVRLRLIPFFPWPARNFLSF